MGRPGLLVKTKTGLKGRTYNEEPLVDGKVKVYLLNQDETVGTKGMLCNPDTMKVLGFID